MGLTLEISSRDALDGITRWLGELGNIDLAKEIKELREKDGLLETLRPRRISISLDSAENPDEPTLASFALDLEVEADFLKGSDGQPVLFLLSYSWSRKDGGFGALEGKLWNGESTRTERPNPRTIKLMSRSLLTHKKLQTTMRKQIAHWILRTRFGRTSSPRRARSRQQIHSSCDVSSLDCPSTACPRTSRTRSIVPPW